MSSPWKDLTEDQCRRKADVMAAALAEVGVFAIPDYKTGGVFADARNNWQVIYRASCLGFQAIGEEPTPWDLWCEFTTGMRP